MYNDLMSSNHRVIKSQPLTPDCYLRPLGVQKVGPIFPARLCNDNDVLVGIVVTVSRQEGAGQLSLLGIK